MSLTFEWDSQKATSNIKKDGVSFEEAKTVFSDPIAYIFDDEWHSIRERREIIIGHSVQNRLLLVCFTEKSKGVIGFLARVLLLWKERKDYEQPTEF